MTAREGDQAPAPLDQSAGGIDPLAEVLASIGSTGQVTGARMAGWARRLQEMDPEQPGSVQRVAQTAREVRQRHGRIVGARVLTRALDVPAWPEAERSRWGLEAMRLSADLTLGACPATDDRTAAVHSLLASADDHRERGDSDTATTLLGDAMALLFHRDLHADAEQSDLVDHPGSYLTPLTGSSTFRALTRSRPQRVRTTPHRRGDDDAAPRVLVVTGAYGSFHPPVVELLREDGVDVQVVDLREVAPVLARKLMDGEVLHRLSRLDREDADDPQIARLRALLSGVDTVFCDWVDRATVWVSRLCPQGVRLVVRAHALDLLDPWFALVDWSTVDHLLTVSEPMRSLAHDLLVALGAPPGVGPPVSVVDSLVPLPDFSRPKHPEARHTLGLVGWGRVVKDPSWALDLLERDARWRLVLVGPGFAATPTPAQASYVDDFRARCASEPLRGRVHDVGRTDDVAEALRHVGVLLSTSRREGSPLAVIEGASSGAVPVVRNWPLLASRGGPRAVYPSEWVVDDIDAAAERVREVTDPGRWPGLGARARRQAAALFDPQAAARRYRELVLGRTTSPN